MWVLAVVCCSGWGCGDDGVSGDGGSTTADDTASSGPSSSSSASSSPSTSSSSSTDGTDTTSGPTTSSGPTTDSDATDDTMTTGTSSGTEPETSSTETGETDTTSEASSSSSTTAVEPADCTVPVSHDTIAAALLDVACPTIFVEPGTYHEMVTVTRDVTIEGTGDGEVIFDAQGGGTTVTILANVNVTLRGLTVTGGSAPQGGGIRSAGTLLLDEVIVRDNEAVGTNAQGGGVFAIGDTEVRTSTIELNTVTASGASALGRGAGIWLQGATLQLTGGTRIADNLVTVNDASGGSGAGGGVFVRIGALVVGDGTIVEDNVVATNGVMGSAFGHVATGGGIAVADSTVTFGDDVVVRDNEVAATGAGDLRIAEGGGLFVSGGSFSAGRLTLDDNRAIASDGPANATGGGAVFSDVLSIELVGLRAHGNVAHATAASAEEEAFARGGAVCVLATSALATTIDIADVVIDDASALAEIAGMATARGGGLLIEAQSGGSAVGRLRRVAIVNGRALADAVGEGGGLAVLGGDASAIDLAVVNATVSGGEVAGSLVARGGDVGIAAPLSGAEVDVQLRFSTIVAGIADPGGSALAVWADASSQAQVLLAKSIVHDAGGGAVLGCSLEGGGVVSQGANLLGGACAAFGTTEDQIDVDPLLASLAVDGDHFVHVPAPGSPAIDVVEPAACVDDLGAALTVDQRGLPRPADAGCEVGSVEVQP